MLVSKYLWCLRRNLHGILHEGGPSDQKAWKIAKLWLHDYITIYEPGRPSNMVPIDIGYPVTVRDYLWQYSNPIDLDPCEGQQT